MMKGASSGFRPQYKPQQQFPRRESLFDGLEPRARPPAVSSLSAAAALGGFAVDGDGDEVVAVVAPAFPRVLVFRRVLAHHLRGEQ